ncbi:hypothetical protein ACFQ3Z_01265 [Streptomyces nogalater]
MSLPVPKVITIPGTSPSGTWKGLRTRRPRHRRPRGIVRGVGTCGTTAVIA